MCGHYMTSFSTRKRRLAGHVLQLPMEWVSENSIMKRWRPSNKLGTVYYLLFHSMTFMFCSVSLKWRHMVSHHESPSRVVTYSDSWNSYEQPNCVISGNINAWCTDVVACLFQHVGNRDFLIFACHLFFRKGFRKYITHGNWPSICFSWCVTDGQCV